MHWLLRVAHAKALFGAGSTLICFCGAGSFSNWLSADLCWGAGSFGAGAALIFRLGAGSFWSALGADFCWGPALFGAGSALIFVVGLALLGTGSAPFFG